MIDLLTKTPAEWADVALSDFPAFLVDHASCERKASAVGMSFVVRYPDRPLLIDPMIHFAREELEHFHQVYRLLHQRGLRLGPDEENVYVNRLIKAVRNGRDERFLDRLLTTSLLEARGCERLHLVAEKLEDDDLKQFYARLARAEARHKDVFMEIAESYFPKDVVHARLAQLKEVEAEAMASVPFRSALH